MDVLVYNNNYEHLLSTCINESRKVDPEVINVFVWEANGINIKENLKLNRFIDYLGLEINLETFGNLNLNGLTFAAAIVNGQINFAWNTKISIGLPNQISDEELKIVADEILYKLPYNYDDLLIDYHNGAIKISKDLIEGNIIRSANN